MSDPHARESAAAATVVTGVTNVTAKHVEKLELRIAEMRETIDELMARESAMEQRLAIFFGPFPLGEVRFKTHNENGTTTEFVRITKPTR